MRPFVRRCLGAPVALLVCWVPQAVAQDLPTVAVREPRAFGYSIGDVVSRTVTVRLPSGYELDESSLPQRSKPGRAIELRKVSRHRIWQADGMLQELGLEYQVFLSPAELRPLELPPVLLRVKGPARVEELRIDAWPVLVGPLSPAEPRLREGLGEMRPDAPPPLIDTTTAWWRLQAYGLAALLLLGYMAHVYIGLPWAARRRRPFAAAWRALRGLPRSFSVEQRQVAFRSLHEALNQTAGLVLFEPDLDSFIAAHQEFAGLRSDLQLFFQRSREQFFASSGMQEAAHDAWLIQICRQCRDAERGSR